VERELSPRDNSYTRISGIGDCRRKIAYSRLWFKEGLAEEPIWSHGLSIFDYGHGLHLQLQQRMSNVGPLKWIDADPVISECGQFGWSGNCELDLVDHEYELAGHCDGISRPMRRIQMEWQGKPFEVLQPVDENRPDTTRYLIDIKTITARQKVTEHRNPRTGELLRTEIKPSAFEKLTAPKDAHIGQTSLYAWKMTRPDFKTDRLPGPLPKLPDLMIIYLAKDLDPKYYEERPKEFPEKRGLLNSPFKIFTRPTDEKVVGALLKKAEQINASLKAGELPARDYHHEPSRPAYDCLDCPFRKACYAKEGYFANDETPLPARFEYTLSQLDSGMKVLG
jgi:hypothetical protein